MEVSIRQLKPSDLETLRSLNREIFISDKKFIDDLNLDWPDSEFGEKYYQQVVHNDNATGFLAEIDSKPVGYVAVCIRERTGRTKTYVEIENMAVYEEYRSQGIGTKLLQRAEEWAQEQGVDRLLVGAASKNPRSVKFYRAFGFDDVEIYLEKDI